MKEENKQLTQKENRKIVFRNILSFWGLFLLCTLVMSAYEVVKERKKGYEAFQQRATYLMNNIYENKSLIDTNGRATTTVNPIWDGIKSIAKDSDQDTLNGNDIRQYYSYQIYSSSGNVVKQSETQFVLKNEESGAIQSLNPKEYLKEEEMDYIMAALDEGGEENPPPYRLIYQTVEQEGKVVPTGFYLVKISWSEEETDQKADVFTEEEYSWKAPGHGNKYVQKGSEISWQWGRSLLAVKPVSECKRADIIAPYYRNGYKSWKYFETNKFLQGADGLIVSPDEKNVYRSIQETKVTGHWESEYKNNLTVELNSGTIGLHIRAVRRCGVNSIVNLTGIYLILFLVLSFCASVVTKEQIRNLHRRMQLEQDRMDFINGMAHEVKTPLAVVRMCSDSLRVPELAEQKEYYLDIMNQKNEQMDQMIRRMIVLSQMNSAYFAMNKIVRRVDTLIEDELGNLNMLIEQRSLSVFTALEEVMWEMDEKYFRQLIVNLLENACYHTPDGGNIWITLTQQSFQIENQGNAIPKEELDSLFELFSRSKDKEGAGHHLGFGLYLAGKVASLHGKTCTVENTARGVLFRVS